MLRGFGQGREGKPCSWANWPGALSCNESLEKSAGKWMKSTAQTSKRRRKGRKGLMRQTTEINFRRKH